MPRGLRAPKLAKAITLPVPAESRHASSQALTLLSTRGVGTELKPGRAFIWHNSGQKPRCPGLGLAPARDPRPRAIPQNSVPRTLGIGRGDRGPHMRPRHVWAPRRGRGLDHHEARQGPTPDVRGFIAATPLLARRCTGEGRRPECSPSSGFGEISDRGLARLPQILLTEPLSPTPWKYPGACRLDTNSLATVARPWRASLPPGSAARFRGGAARARAAAGACGGARRMGRWAVRTVGSQVTGSEPRRPAWRIWGSYR